MKILVTGGTGFIGSHTVVELQKKGYDVIIVDNLSNSEGEIVDSIRMITGIRPDLEVFDLIDKKKTVSFFEQHNDLIGIIHFAALKKVGQSVKEPLNYYRNNLESLVNILEAMENNNIPNIVFSSSCSIYGQPKDLPVREDAPIQEAESPYGNTKIISEEIINDFVKVNNISVINLRYFNPVGAHSTALIGELPIGVEPNLIPIINQVAIGLHEQLSIFGNDYNTHDGTAIRDYIHVVDVARAHVVAINRMLNKKMVKKSESFNLGTGIGYSVLDIVKAFEKISGLKLNYKFVKRREGDIEKVWANPDLSNKVLGWKAEYDLEEMIRSAWKWELAYRSLTNIHTSFQAHSYTQD